MKKAFDNDTCKQLQSDRPWYQKSIALSLNLENIPWKTIAQTSISGQESLPHSQLSRAFKRVISMFKILIFPMFSLDDSARGPVFFVSYFLFLLSLFF